MQFEHEITLMLMAVADGLYVGTTGGLYFIRVCSASRSSSAGHQRRRAAGLRRLRAHRAGAPAGA
jgi:hypothetical protein